LAKSELSIKPLEASSAAVKGLRVLLSCSESNKPVETVFTAGDKFRFVEVGESFGKFRTDWSLPKTFKLALAKPSARELRGEFSKVRSSNLTELEDKSSG